MVSTTPMPMINRLVAICIRTIQMLSSQSSTLFADLRGNDTNHHQRRCEAEAEYQDGDQAEHDFSAR